MYSVIDEYTRKIYFTGDYMDCLEYLDGLDYISEDINILSHETGRFVSWILR